MDLDALADFNLVAASGGLGAAARASGRPKTTLSRRLADLERQLGVRLVERGDRGLRLTEEGRQLHEQTRGLLAEIAEIGETIASGAAVPRGTLRISAPMVLAHVALAAVAIRYARACPQVQLEIVAEDRRVDPVEDGYDVVLRIDPSAEERLVGRRVASDRRLIVAAPGEPIPAGESEERPVRGVMMAAANPRSRWPAIYDDGEAIVFVPEPVLRFSSLLMVRDAVCAGAGVALLPELLVGPDIAAGRLRRWGRLDAPPVEIWALHSTRRLASAKVRAFIAEIEHGFGV